MFQGRATRIDELHFVVLTLHPFSFHRSITHGIAKGELKTSFRLASGACRGCFEEYRCRIGYAGNPGEDDKKSLTGRESNRATSYRIRRQAAD